jgi:hypothetical protein
MRLLTHQFAHSETLDRARRWLIDAGVSPDRMHAHRHGVPSLTLFVEPAEVDGIELVIHAAENGDPDGLPSFWELARLEPDADTSDRDGLVALAAPEREPSFLLEWHPVDPEYDEETRRQIELQRAYCQMWP